MSIVRLTLRPWYVRLAPVYIWAAASLAFAFFLYMLLPLPLLILFSPLLILCCGLIGHVSTLHIRKRVAAWLSPTDYHDFSTIRPSRLILEDGQLVGFTCYRVVRCGCCKKRYRFIPVTEDQLAQLLREFFWRIGSRSEDPLRSDKTMLASELKSYGIRLETKYTTSFGRFYSLEYNSSEKVLMLYRPPKELERMVGIRRHVVQVLDKASRWGENEVIYLLAVKIKIDDSHYTMSTCILEIMRAEGVAWLHKTPHTLPPRLDDHLARVMGLNPGNGTMKAEGGGVGWPPPGRVPT
ncbi:MAG: hypothetical protein QW420_03070 [Candidatus Caldarchaeum sp.]